MAAFPNLDAGNTGVPESAKVGAVGGTVPPAPISPMVPNPPGVNREQPGRPGQNGPPGGAGYQLPGPGSNPTSRPTGGIVLRLPKVPGRSYVQAMPKGVRLKTPAGIFTHDEDGQVQFEQGAGFEDHMQQRRKSFGPTPFDREPGFADVEPPVAVSGRHFNPFTGAFGGGEEE